MCRIYLTVVALALALVSCRKEALADEPLVRIEFNITQADASRATGVSASAENRVNRWALLVYSVTDGALEAYGTSGNASGIVCSLPAGTYDVRAWVNYPTTGSWAFNPSQLGTLSAFESRGTALGSNAVGDLMMAGGERMTFTAGDGASKSVTVRRLVAKAGVERISVNMTNPAHRAMTFTVRNIFLTNVYQRSSLGSDPGVSALSSNQGLWFNAMGLRSVLNGALDALVCDLNVNRTIADGGSYDTPHYFYFFPNPVVDDNRSSVWSVRRTRLVVEAVHGGNTCYYVVTLPLSVRNRTYIITELRISQPGSLTPEQDTPYAMEVVFAPEIEGWRSPYNVSEQS